MDENQQILKAYLKEDLQKHTHPAEDILLDWLGNHIFLEEGQSDISKEERTLYLKDNYLGIPSARLKSWYNVVKINTHDLIGLSISAVPIMGMAGKPYFQIAWAILALAHSFSSKLEYKDFEPLDAKILAALFELKKEDFTIPELMAAFKAKYEDELTEERLNKAIGFFRTKNILRYLGNHIYRLQEKIKYEGA